MEKVFYNDIEISDWTDYITVKFANNNFFEIQKSEDETFWSIKSKTNNTSIEFRELSADKKGLDSCTYQSKDCKSFQWISNQWWAQQTDEHFGSFTQENVNILDKELDIPIYMGWFSIDYYLFGKFFKAKAYTGKHKPTFENGGMFGGCCLGFILLPISILVSFLMNIGIIGEKREILIRSIIEEADIIFPSLSEKQVALLRAKYATGQVLNNNFDLHIRSKKEEIYTVFDTLDLARQYVEEQKTKHKNVEFWIYGQDEKEICYIEPDKL